MNRLSVEDRARILHGLCEGLSLRGAARVFDCSLKTVVRVVAEVGDWAIDFLNHQPQIEIETIQVDEIWSFIGYNEGKVGNKRMGDGRHGVVWTWVGVCPKTGLIVGHHLGNRRTSHGAAFMKKIASRLKRDDHHRFVTRPTIISDGWVGYKDAVELGFGDDVNFGVYEKCYTKLDKNGEATPQSRFAGALRKALIGNPAIKEITTWRIERENGYIRQANRRYTRKTNAFSKVHIYHERMLAIVIVHRNYCWLPNPRRPRDGSGNWEKRVPAAMAASLTDHVWNTSEMIAAADLYRKNRTLAIVTKAPEKAVDPTRTYPFWVNHSPNNRRAKTHAHDCSSCNGGHGKLSSPPKTNEWFGFDTLEEAEAYGRKAEPDNYALCRLCLSNYNLLSTYGRRR